MNGESIVFDNLVFPISGSDVGTVIVDTGKASNVVGKSFEPIALSSEIIAKITEYADWDKKSHRAVNT